MDADAKEEVAKVKKEEDAKAGETKVAQKDDPDEGLAGNDKNKKEPHESIDEMLKRYKKEEAKKAEDKKPKTKKE